MIEIPETEEQDWEDSLYKQQVSEPPAKTRGSDLQFPIGLSPKKHETLQ